MLHARYILSLCWLLMLCVFRSYANDSTYNMSGNHLVPINESRISISKEVLSIDLCDDGYATVNVEYTMINPDVEKTVIMGFEAKAPNFGTFNEKGIHPYILDFEVVLNGDALAYKTSVVYDDTLLEIKEMDRLLTPEQCEEQTGNSLDDCLYDLQAQKMVPFAYAYFFEARFRPGENHIHHHYRYKLSDSVAYTYYLSYLLTPAMRWANHCIDDFTLVISTPSTSKHFVVIADTFMGENFQLLSGCGKMRNGQTNSEEIIEFSLRNASVQWQKKNFVASSDLRLYSADYIFRDKRWEAVKDGRFYDRSVPQINFDYCEYSFQELSLFQRRLLRNLPFASRGYVFKSPDLKEYFENLWWYLPDSELKDPMKDFTDFEKIAIKLK